MLFLPALSVPKRLLQPSHHAGAKVFDDDIGGRDQPADHFGRLFRFQIEDKALLADIELAEGGAAIIPQRRAASHRLAVGLLDLDDLRAHIRQHSRAMRTGDGGRKIENAKTREALCQISLIVFRYRHSKLPRTRSSSLMLTQAPLDSFELPRARRPWRGVTLDGEA